MHTLFHSRGRAWSAAAVAAALTLIAGASAGVNTPHSGWYSGNPTLGPNNLTDLVCGGTTCYAAGAFGTLLKSTNAGSTWSGVVTGLTLDLRRVRMAGSPDRIVVGGGCSLRRSDDGGATWLQAADILAVRCVPGGVLADLALHFSPREDETLDPIRIVVAQAQANCRQVGDGPAHAHKRCRRPNAIESSS
jgi:hypothetical protein